MKWIAQVNHVARKDLRQVSWILLLYAIAIAIAANGVLSRKSFGPYNTAPNEVTMGMPDSLVVILPGLLMLLGIISAAALLQLDSPTRPNAFWTTRPLSPSAVLTSKLLVIACGIIGVALAGAAVALAYLDTSRVMMARILLSATMSSAEWALAVLVLGALTRDLRDFFGVLVATLIGYLLLTWGVTEMALVLPVVGCIVLTVVSVASGLWFVMRLYRKHERRPATWIAGIAIATALITASLAIPDFLPDVPTLSKGAPVEISPREVANLKAGLRFSMNLRVAQAADSERLDFTPESITFGLPGGKSLLINTPVFYPSVVSGATPWIGHAVKWMNIDPAKFEWPSNIRQELPEQYRDTVAKGINSIRVGGLVTVSHAHVVASLPLERNAELVRDGRRIRIYADIEHKLGEAKVWIQLSSVARAGMVPQVQQRLREHSNLQFALVNDQRGEAMLLDTDGSYDLSNGAIVLPQVGLSTMFNVFSTRTSLSGLLDAVDDAEWYKGARLVVVEWDIVGQYRSAAEALLQ